MLDLVLRGGRVCDGSGGSAHDADVGIEVGRVVAIGRTGGAARRTLDARGLIVAPGFVDVHTHYDAQVTWDRLCTPSCWHGVTSVVIGNCGFALAPCRPSDRERLLRMLEHVEGMPFESLHAGVAWEWESFAEYVRALRARPLGVNVGALLGHSALRAYVMGDDAYTRAGRGGRDDGRPGARGHGRRRARIRHLALARARRRGRAAGPEPAGAPCGGGRARRRDGGVGARRARDHARDLPRVGRRARLAPGARAQLAAAGELQRD